MLPSPLLLLAFLAVPQTPDAAWAPPPLEIEGHRAVPVDVLSLEARVVFDVGRRRARAEARMRFTLGEEGWPLFDLRQPEVEALSLDGAKLRPSRAAAVDRGGTCGTVRVLRKVLPAGGEHVLEMAYPLEQPASPGSIPIGWGKGRLSWDFWMSDLNPGRYLEQWFPSGFVHDRFPFTLELEVKGLETEHELVTNAEVEESGPGRWRLRFPAHYTPLSPMLVLVPAEEVEREVREVVLRDGRRITVDLCRRKEAPGSLDSLHEHIARDLQAFTDSTGPWAHGGRCTVYQWTGDRSMEYDGATTSSLGALSHEIFHSWYGRGVRPASQNDGWIDEAWTTWMTSPRRRGGRLAPEDPPVVLASADPWNRVTPGASYGAGARLFSRLARGLGEEALLRAMAAFFQERSPEPVTTKDLEEHLAEAAGSGGAPVVHALFERFVRGREVEVPAWPEG